jgi:hypothetical protein
MAGRSYRGEVSISVELDDLADVIAAEFGSAGYVITIAPDGRPRIAHVAVSGEGRNLRFRLGPGGTKNATERPELTVLFAGPAEGEMSLIVDGQATVGRGDEPEVELEATWGVRHRAVPRG